MSKDPLTSILSLGGERKTKDRNPYRWEQGGILKCYGISGEAN
jgi:hypothetical protein